MGTTARDMVTGSSDLAILAAELVTAYVANNAVAVADLPQLIISVHGALAGAGRPVESARTHEPAVPVKRSITPDALISLIDGKPYRMLKRHLSRHGLTPNEYRQRYGLPVDYPMSAPSYSAKRSELAKKVGLGVGGRRSAAATKVPAGKRSSVPTSKRSSARGRRS